VSGRGLKERSFIHLISPDLIQTDLIRLNRVRCEATQLAVVAISRSKVGQAVLSRSHGQLGRSTAHPVWTKRGQSINLRLLMA